jgi:hypothetical protein
MQIDATYSNRSEITKTRPVCAYPEVAIYKGSGDMGDATSLECGKPSRQAVGLN